MAKRKITTEEIKEASMPVEKAESFIISPEHMLSSGSTLLDLAISNKVGCAYPLGSCTLFVGDSRAGKSLAALTAFAEAAKSPQFDNYDLIHDNAENGALFPIAQFWGNKTASRVEPPKYDDDGDPAFSASIEEFYFNMDDRIRSGKPFVYIMDSYDVLTSDAECSKFDSNKKEFAKGKEMAGAYGDGKAKIHSANMRRLIAPLKKSKSILIGISQTRDKIGHMAFGKGRSGGYAITFYNSVEIWYELHKPITRTVNGIARPIGNTIKVKIKKNRVCGCTPTIYISVLNQLGIDDTNDCINYLVETEKHWGKSGTKIIAPEFDFEGTQEKLIQTLEEADRVLELQKLCETVWNDIREKSKVSRKSRYE